MLMKSHALARSTNRGQTFLLLVAIASVSGLAGWVVGGVAGAMWALILAAGVALLAPRMSPAMLMRMYRARPLLPHEVPALYDVVSDMARRAGLPRTPRLFLVPSPVMNAFAVGGRKDAVIAVTSGLLNRLDMEGLAGVLAHEISHILHEDLQAMTLADIFSRITGVFSTIGKVLLFINLPLLLVGDMTVSWGLVLVLLGAPGVSMLLQLALSRTREFDADASAARLTGDPLGLARALASIEYQQGSLFDRLFFPGRKEQEPSLLRSHPVTDERVARLKGMADEPWAQPRYRFTQVRQPQSFRIVHPRWRFGGYWISL
ncbi:zinc metalloprotease HtpX [Desulfovibrio mangrovi]|uniref:zinc metalloprotease HtpX n=1 Tax=Desulfovibrio mangrovi TaxID=2976983 RepID=UPI002247B117|nr:zinc metalloprotease HtpX [Desulfovibrio mangrovi]UZP67739.1 zinc metalloprotease HtpX [Desulfovibrio mangrovi]